MEAIIVMALYLWIGFNLSRIARAFEDYNKKF
jgi:hypothetical protein